MVQWVMVKFIELAQARQGAEIIYQALEVRIIVAAKAENTVLLIP